VAGQVVDAYGQPIPDFRLWLRSDSASLGWVPVRSDQTGHYQIADAPSGPLVFRTQSFPSFHIRGPVLAPGGEQEVPLVLDWGEHAIYGRVENAHGDPIATPNIFLHWSHQRDGVQSQSTRRAASDGHGNFQFIGLGPGPHRISVTAPGYGTSQLAYEVGSAFEPVVVRLQESGR
jgi:hypothetical protein